MRKNKINEEFSEKTGLPDFILSIVVIVAIIVIGFFLWKNAEAIVAKVFDIITEVVFMRLS